MAPPSPDPPEPRLSLNVPPLNVTLAPVMAKAPPIALRSLQRKSVSLKTTVPPLIVPAPELGVAAVLKEPPGLLENTLLLNVAEPPVISNGLIVGLLSSTQLLQVKLVVPYSAKAEPPVRLKPCKTIF